VVCVVCGGAVAGQRRYVFLAAKGSHFCVEFVLCFVVLVCSNKSLWVFCGSWSS
jgi:hypothetical protein